MTRNTLCSTFLAALTPLATAQTPLVTLPGSAPFDEHSYALGGVDLDGDGVPDVVVGAPDDDTGAIDAGRVTAYSGVDQSALWTRTGSSGGGNLGAALAWADDYDGDGTPEVVVGIPFQQVGFSAPGGLEVLSGQTGALLRSVLGDDSNEGFGWSVTGGFDWNIDGVEDYAAGAPLDDDLGTNAGSFAVFDGASGAPLAVVHGDAPGDLMGWSMAGGPVDLAPYGDLVVGAVDADRPGLANVGLVRVYGRSGLVIWSRWGNGGGDALGFSVAAVGDLNGDGRGEVLGGAPYADGAGSDAGRATLFDGQTSNDLQSWSGSATDEWLGYAVAGAGDINGDGLSELVLGAPQAGGVGMGYAQVIDGATGSALFAATGDQPGDQAGWSVGGAGDVNQDGIADVLMGARNGQGPAGNTGWVRVVSGGCGGVVSYCTAGVSASGCQPTLVAGGVPSASAPSGFTVRAWPVEGGKDGLFYFGTNGRQASPWGNGSSFQCVVPPVKRGGILPGNGTPSSCDGLLLQDMNARWTAKPAQNPGAGAIVQLQCWYRDPLNTSNQTTSTSDAIEFIVCP